MNQQEENIDQNELQSHHYIYPFVGVGLVLSIALEWYAMALLIMIWGVMVLRDAWRTKLMEEVRRGLKDFPWYSIHRLCKDSLEMLKCRRMMERGYDSRANTNIILQEEKEHPIPFKLSPAESTIASSIVNISHLLHSLYLIKIKVF